MILCWRNVPIVSLWFSKQNPTQNSIVNAFVALLVLLKGGMLHASGKIDSLNARFKLLYWTHKLIKCYAVFRSVEVLSLSVLNDTFTIITALLPA